MISRRALLAGTAGTASQAALGQTRRLPSIVFAASGIPSADLAGDAPRSPLYRAFLAGLNDAGWINGKTAIIEAMSADGISEREDAILAGLVARKVDVVAMGPARSMLTKALAATRTIPIVAYFGDDPVAAKFISSLAKPGGNITGLTSSAGPDIYGKRLELLRECVPTIKRTVFLSRPEEFVGVSEVPRPAGLDLLHQPITTIDSVAPGLAATVAQKPDSLMVAGGPPFLTQAPRFVAFAQSNKLPAIYNQRVAAEAGGLMSYGPNTLEAYAKLGRVVDKVLRGTAPADIPVEQPTRFELVLNAKAAAEIGVTFPPTLLVRADEVIE